MPTNLGALPTNQPIPNGRVQMKRGGAETAITLNTATPYGTKLGDGAGGDMQITYTPSHSCIWIVKSNVMAHGVSDGVGWRRWDHAIFISPADADGITEGFRCPHQVYDNSSVEWRMVGGSYAFKLNAGTAYTAYLGHVSLSGGSIQFHTGWAWIRILGRVVAEGNI